MEEKILEVNYLVDGKLFVIPTKVIHDKSNENEAEKVYYEIKWRNLNIISEASTVTEIGILNLQKSLPKNMELMCCQSCRNGNFSPYGDVDNEIFCLKDIIIEDKNDVLDFFIINSELAKNRSRKLLYYCSDYQAILESQYYTYNNWHNYNRANNSK